MASPKRELAALTANSATQAGREKPSDCVSAIAQTVSSSPEMNRII